MTTNDRFKFKVFDAYYKCWLKEFHISENGKVLLWDYNSREFEDSCREQDFIICQCTGLKDCEGKLIYEGDILINKRIPASDGPYYWVVEFGKFLTSEGFHGKYFYGFYAKRCRADHESSLLQLCDYVEVVGNIYENPDLLTENNK